jgi:hypothetical protein
VPPAVVRKIAVAASGHVESSPPAPHLTDAPATNGSHQLPQRCTSPTATADQ